MVPQHSHDLQLVVSSQQQQQTTEMMDTGVVVQQQQQQQQVQQQISTMNHHLLESVLQQSQVDNSELQMLQQQLSPVLFGSQMVDKNSSTPYTDATQVLNRYQITRIVLDRASTRSYDV